MNAYLEDVAAGVGEKLLLFIEYKGGGGIRGTKGNWGEDQGIRWREVHKEEKGTATAAVLKGKCNAYCITIDARDK